MPKKYKNILTGYINERTDGSGKQYLVITNVSDEAVTLEPKGRIFLNKTPYPIKQKNSKVPDFTKAVAIDDGQEESEEAEQVNDSIPF